MEIFGPLLAPFIPLYKDGDGIPKKSHSRTLSNLFRKREREISVLERESLLVFPIMAFPPFRDTEEMVYHIRETFKWHLRMASRPPRQLLEVYRDSCSSFTLSDAEEAARYFNIPEIVQATFYVMLLNDILELSVVSRDMAGGLKLTHKGLRWTTFES